MFQTSKDMQLYSPTAIAMAGRQQWHSVAQSLMVRWFHIRYVAAGTSVEQILMTGDMDVLEAVSGDPSLSLVRVGIMCPPHVNGTQHWSFSVLHSVTTLLKVQAQSEQLIGYEYQLADGCTYFEQISTVITLGNGGVQRIVLVVRGD